ncbi:hypothetical protein V495_01090 [Pseudogymnoascus sp. VKM F-4514 (FW-929)]|nr:hypothetical protein V495_01090 [Pseudogymnoascus sp. VKM F-4514 (FW-929)]KFY61353.1 hypothetical protein V497_02993 [Pseudogymnoascus sp. VKM F-4516 (FW-969)]
MGASARLIRESDQQRAVANHSTVHRVPSVPSRAQPPVLNFVDSAHRQHQPIEGPQKTRLANLTPPVTSRFTPLPQQTLSLKVGIENPPEPVGFALGLPCAEELHCPPLAHCSPRTVGLLPAYSSMHDAWHANPIIKQSEALLERCGGRGPHICDCDNLISSQSQSRSSERPNTSNKSSYLASPHTYSNFHNQEYAPSVTWVPQFGNETRSTRQTLSPPWYLYAPLASHPPGASRQMGGELTDPPPAPSTGKEAKEASPAN